MNIRRATGTPAGTRGTRGTRPITAITVAALAGLSLTLLAGQALAKGGKARPAAASAKAPKVDKKEVHACGIIYEKAKERVSTAHLREAREMLGKCALPKCGSFLQQECTTLYTQLDADVPTIVPVVTDDTGSPHALVEVRMDGEILTSKLDGHAISVDPGKHVFSFSTDAGVFATQKVMIVQGQRNRSIAALLHSKKAGGAAMAGDQPAGEGGAEAAAPVAAAGETGEKAAAPETAAPEEDAEAEAAAAEAQAVDTEGPGAGKASAAAMAPKSGRLRSSTPVLAYVAGGVGILGITGFGLLTYWGHKDNNILMGCADGCDPVGVRHVRKLYLAADISLGVGLVAAGVSTWLFARPHYVREKSPVQARYIDVQPTPSGAVASVGGSF